MMKHLRFVMIVFLLLLFIGLGTAAAEETYVRNFNLGNLEVGETGYFHLLAAIDVWWPADRYDEPYITCPSVDWGDDDVYYTVSDCENDPFPGAKGVYHNGIYCDEYTLWFEIWVGMTIKEDAYAGKSERHFIIKIDEDAEMLGASSDQYDVCLKFTILPYPNCWVITPAATYKVTSDGNSMSYAYPNGLRSKIVIPDYVSLAGFKYPVIRIGSKVFDGNDDISVVTIGKNVKFIESYAFRNCVNLIKVTGGKGLVKIGAGAFKGCKNLNSFYLQSDKLTSIGNQAFLTAGHLKASTYRRM